MDTADWRWVGTFLASPPAAQVGYYHRNYRAEHHGQVYLVRVPAHSGRDMDFRAIPEGEALRHITATLPGLPVPRVLHETSAWAIHSFLPGVVLATKYPGAAPLPDWVPLGIARQMRALHQVDPAPLGRYCAGIARSPDSGRLFQSACDFVERVYWEDLRPSFAGEYAKLGVPPDPFAQVRDLGGQLDERAFCLCHCDVHRKNLILGPSGTLAWLDWELALVADPAYDVAVHLHKMRYAPVQEVAFLRAYAPRNNWRTLRKQVAVYLRLERVKSALVDLGRVLRDASGGALTQAEVHFTANQYYRKLQGACAVWGQSPPPEKVAGEVLTASLR